MHPAFSVIFFTVVSGAGYGLMIAAGLALALGIAMPTRVELLAALALGATFSVAGLFASLLHLGQPARAWRAFSQWRSSWLSREGVAAVLTFVPLAAAFVLVWSGSWPNAAALCGALLILGALATLYCTAGIYRSLKTIRAWHNGYVLPGYLLFGAANGAAWAWLIDGVLGDGAMRIALATATAVLALGAAALKFAYWRFLDAPVPGPTPESATGLGRFGSVRSVEAPHTEENYLTNEMGFRLARKHAARLRRIAVLLIGAVPVLCALIALLAVNRGGGIVLAAAATFAMLLGTFVERWLFFAEARHVVMLYYAERR